MGGRGKRLSTSWTAWKWQKLLFRFNRVARSLCSLWLLVSFSLRWCSTLHWIIIIIEWARKWQTILNRRRFCNMLESRVVSVTIQSCSISTSKANNVVESSWNMPRNVLMASCLTNIFYESLIGRQRSYRDNRSAVLSSFPLIFVKLFETRLRIPYHDLDVFAVRCIEVNSVLPDITRNVVVDLQQLGFCAGETLP